MKILGLNKTDTRFLSVGGGLVYASDGADLTDEFTIKLYVVDFGNSNSINPNRREFLNLYTKAKLEDERFVIEDSWTDSSEFKVELTGVQILEYLQWKAGTDTIPADAFWWFIETFCNEVAE